MFVVLYTVKIVYICVFMTCSNILLSYGYMECMSGYMGLPHCPHCSSVLARGIQVFFAHPAQQNISSTKQWRDWLKIQINLTHLGTLGVEQKLG